MWNTSRQELANDQNTAGTCARMAWLSGRGYVTPDDVKVVAAPALAHRLTLRGGPDIKVAAGIVQALLDRVPVPRG